MSNLDFQELTQYYFDFTKTDNYLIFLLSKSMTPLNCETFFSLIFS